MLALIAAGVALSAVSYVVTDWCIKGRPVLSPAADSRPVEAA